MRIYTLADPMHICERTDLALIQKCTHLEIKCRMNVEKLKIYFSLTLSGVFAFKHTSESSRMEEVNKLFTQTNFSFCSSCNGEKKLV